MTCDDKFNVGIIGYGLSAKIFHIPFIVLTPSLHLHSIVQRTPTPGNSAPDDFPTATTGVRHFASAEELLTDTELHVIIIATPPNTHYSLAREALRRGKHVVVEKPFVPTSAEAHELAYLAKEKGCVLTVYQNRRWDADFLTVQKLLAEGTLGRVVEFETHFDRLRLERPATSWKGMLSMRDGGGVLYDLGTHLLDQVVVLFGIPSGVFAKFVRQRDGQLATGSGGLDDEPDSVSLVLSYAETGLLVHVRIAVVSVETQQMRFWVRGTKGSYHKTGLDPQEDQLRGGGKATDADFGKEDPSRYGRLCVVGEDGKVKDCEWPTAEPQTYRRFYEMFARAVASGDEKDIPVTATQAAAVLTIIEAAKESARTGKEVAI